MTYDKLYYDGAWQSSTATESTPVISSATEHEIGRVMLFAKLNANQ